MLLIRNGYLFTLVSRGRYTDPCTDRGFQTIARSVDISTSGAIAAEQGMDEALGSPGSESFGERMEEYTRVARNRQVIFGLTMLITLIGLPAYLTYYWLMRRKRLMREAEFEAQLATAPELELARVILNRQEYSLDAVDIAERELARHGRREQMLEDARLRQEAGFDDDESGILLGDAAIRRRVLRGTAMGVISGGVILATIVLRLRNGAAANDPDIVIFSIIGWALVCWALSYSVYRRKLGAALGLIPTLIYLPLWTSVDTGTLSLLPLVLLAIPSVQTVRAIEDGMKKQEQRIDMASVGWEG
jgi:hypothetical protein